MSMIECIPNISEGRRPEVVAACVAAVERPGVVLLDVGSDPDHNRSVLTFAGEAPALEEAVVALFGRAIERIDMRSHHGVHPRLGAVDVVPFVPLDDTPMDACVSLARRVAVRVASAHALPVFLYEEAATTPQRRGLEHVRRGQFEGLSAKLADPAWAPDYGPAVPHETAGASVVGARWPLIAFNVNLATDRLDIAREIAGVVRWSSGGLPFVKALGVPLPGRGIVQVTMNLTRFTETPLFRVFDVIAAEARRRGVEVLESEIVGLVPAAALTASGAWYLRVARFEQNQVLETRLRERQSAS